MTIRGFMKRCNGTRIPGTFTGIVEVVEPRLLQPTMDQGQDVGKTRSTSALIGASINVSPSRSMEIWSHLHLTPSGSPSLPRLYDTRRHLRTASLTFTKSLFFQALVVVVPLSVVCLWSSQIAWLYDVIVKVSNEVVHRHSLDAMIY